MSFEDFPSLPSWRTSTTTHSGELFSDVFFFLSEEDEPREEPPDDSCEEKFDEPCEEEFDEPLRDAARSSFAS